MTKRSSVSCAVIAIVIGTCPGTILKDLLEKICISKIDPKIRNIRVVYAKVKGQAAVAGQIRDRYTSGGAGRELDGLAESTAVHILGRTVFRIERAVITGAVGIITIKVLEAQGIGIVRYKLVVGHIISQVQTGHFGSGQSGTVAAVLKLVIVDVGHIPHLLIIDIGGVIGIIDSDEGGRVLDVDQVILIRTVVDGNIISPIILIVIQIVSGVIVVVCGIIIIPGLKIRAIGVVVIIGGILVQKVFKLNVGFVIVGGGIVRGIVDGIEGFVIAVDDIGSGGIAAPVVIGDVAIFVLHAAGRGGIVFLGLIHRKKGTQPINKHPLRRTGIKPFFQRICTILKTSTRIKRICNK